MAIISWLIDSPVSPMTALVPLIFVIGVTAAKQGYEDIQRHKSDNEVNRTTATIIENGKEKLIQSQYLAPGDLVVVKRDCDVPCDLVLLQSSDPHGKCFITTANLDGESNLKTFMVPRDLPQVELNKISTLGYIECENSKTDLYSFNGKIQLSGNGEDILPLSAENLLLRGSRVKNTEQAIGCAVYTGMQTKLQMNSRHTRNKFASSELYLNRFLIFILFLMVATVTILYLLKNHAELTTINVMEYIGTTVDINSIGQFLQDYFSFLVLFKYLIPISMYVTIELHRVMAGQFMRWDLQLYDEETDQPCMVNTTNLNEELGQINILFSDKTGTLTKNEMVFKQCSIAGRKYNYKRTQLEEVGSELDMDYNMFNVVVFQPTQRCTGRNLLPSALLPCVPPLIVSSLPIKWLTDCNFFCEIEPDGFGSFSWYPSECGMMNQRDFFQALAICHTVQVAGEIDGNSSENFNEIETPIQVNSNGVEKTLHKVFEEQVSHDIQKALPALTNFQRQISKTIQSLDYQSSSADEKALVEACAHLGLVYTGDDDEILKVRIVAPHEDSINAKEFVRLHILEFTSERKRMSVIVKDNNGLIWIYTKGAESCIFPLCSEDSKDMVTKTDGHITDFARLGLRTLAIARRQINADEYQKFLEELKEASISLDHRQKLNEDCYAKVERDLELLGATAVEDALQDNVADTLISLKQAGIKTWVLTGDKMETALNIAISCGHITQNSLRYIITDCKNKEEMLDHLDNVDFHMKFGKNQDFALLIDGTSLAVALSETPTEFRDIAIQCTAVLCCRLSPLQKSKVVWLIKNAPEKFITAAIGDGANDVSMIQEAHVGIGVMGKEGHQAAQCADFAFAKFSMLKRLLLVHGHYNTIRLSLLLLYFFYKDVFLMGIMFLFQFQNLFSTTSAFDSLPMTLYNVIYTTLPILFLSLSEKPYSEELLMSQPELYTKNAKNKPLRWTPFFKWNISGVYHAVICFYFTSFIFASNDVILNVGQTADLACYCALLMHIVIVIVNLKLWIETKYQSYFYIATIFFSIMVYIGTMVLYNWFNLQLDTDLYWAYNKLLGSIPVWLYCIITTVACLLPDFIMAIVKQEFNWPNGIFKFKFRSNVFVKKHDKSNQILIKTKEDVDKLLKKSTVEGMRRSRVIVPADDSSSEDDDNADEGVIIEIILQKFSWGECLFVGDFNIDIKSESTHSIALKNIFAEYNLNSLHNMVTRPSSKSSIDGVFGNLQNFVQICSIENGLTDHNYINCILRTEKTWDIRIEKELSIVDYDMVGRYLDENLEMNLSICDPAEQCNDFVECFKNAISFEMGSKSNINYGLKDVNGELLSSDSEKANAFNQFFDETIHIIRNNIPVHPDDNINNFGTLWLSQTIFNLNKIDNSALENILENMPLNKGSGHDGITVKSLLIRKRLTTIFLTRIFNSIIQNSIYPDKLKIHKIIPIPKSTSSQDIALFRPISMLSNISKIFEKLIYNQISDYLEKNQMMFRRQYGFQKGIGTDTALINVINDICNGLDKGYSGVAAVFFDLSKAFDLVDHRILLSKLRFYGIQTPTIKLLESYLCNRKQCVNIGQSNSNFKQIVCGVPQGSVLGPLLFKIYINDLQNLDLKGKIYMYADDICILYYYKHPSVLKTEIEYDASLICEFIRLNKLTLNAAKTQFIRFRPHALKKDEDMFIYVDGNPIFEQKIVKYLGACLQYNLNWDTHIEKLKEKVCRATGVLRKFKHKLSADTKLRLYQALIHSHFLYAPTIYGHKKSNALKSLQSAQNKALKIVFNLPNDFSTLNIFKNYATNILPIKGIYQNHILIYMFKAVTNNGFSLVQFKRNRNQHNINTRQEDNLISVRCRTELTKQRIEYAGPQEYNALPQTLKIIARISVFKSSLKKYILGKIETLI
ncbi:phospholipid-transporting ATPase IF-like [Haematobia irritans]|uniref:phospholipid-transporting ATPase IF-like n=1 Tax=Haematobia irritans TaxID=7368 RepID=UPI003F4FA93F